MPIHLGILIASMAFVTEDVAAFSASSVSGDRQLSRHSYQLNMLGDDDLQNKLPSWWLPSQTPESKVRQERLLSEMENMKRFVQGKELEELVTDVNAMKINLKYALATDDITRIIALKKAIKEAENKNPEIVYTRALRKMERARTMHVKKKYKILAKYSKEAEAARAYIPRLNMEGLWVGNAGRRDSLIVNVTYAGDNLIATVVKENKHDLPRDEVAFEAYLGPKTLTQEGGQLSSIQVSGAASTKWGMDKLDRFTGKGRMVYEDGRAIKTVDGQLITFDSYFSFLWVPSRRHIFFSRPTSEMIMQEMRDTISEDDELQNTREHLLLCFDKSIDTAFIRPTDEERQRPDPFRRIQRREDLATASEETEVVINHAVTSLIDTDKYSFWDLHKWKAYIDSVLK